MLSIVWEDQDSDVILKWWMLRMLSIVWEDNADVKE